VTETTVYGLCGSLRDGSYTRPSLRVALAEAENTGATTDLFDLREHLRDADAVVLGTPVYHGSYATPLKNALDYCGFDEFEATTVGLVAVAGGSFPVTALDHLRSVCRALDAWVLPHQTAVPNASRRFDGRELVGDDIRERLETLGRRTVEYAHIEPDPPCPESLENVGARS